MTPDEHTDDTAKLPQPVSSGEDDAGGRAAPEPPGGQDSRPRRLLRVPEGRVAGGVCAGLGRYFDVDPVIFRVAAIALTLVGGLGLVLYVVAWILVPRDDGTGDPAGPDGWRGAVAALGSGARALTAGGVLKAAALTVLALCAAAILFFGAAWATAAGGGAVAAGLVVAVGALLVVAAFRGGARWLAIPALLIALPVGVVSAAGVDVDGGVGEREYRPGSRAALPAGGYKLGAGRIEIDLRGLDWERGARVDLPVRLGLGQAVVVVPETVCTDLAGRIGAGYADLLGRGDGGLDVDLDDSAAPPAGTPRLTVDADIGMGELAVVHDPADADEWDGDGWDQGERGGAGRPLGNAACRA